MEGYVVAPSALRAAEYELEEKGVTEDELISRAAAHLTAEVKKHADKKDKILVVVGSGNNGCDGLECALTLKLEGYNVGVMLATKRCNEANFRRREAVFREGTTLKRRLDGDEAVIVDAVFGTGIGHDPDPEPAKAMIAINRSDAFVISADLPSGLNAESGRAYFPTIKADVTVTFAYLKSGMLLGEARNFCGEIIVRDIGVKCEAIGKLLSSDDVRLAERMPVTHKGTYGKTIILGGCDVMPGAPLMAFESAVAASRSGAGLVTLCVPESLKCAYQARVKETMLRFMPDDGKNMLFDRDELRDIIKKYETIVIGPGMGNNEETRKIVRYLAMSYYGILVVDADGINAIAPHINDIKHHTCTLVLTPHTVEFVRLCPKCGEGNYLDNIRSFALKYRCCIAVKSATTIITNGQDMFFNVTGTPAMAKGGSGDVLAGMTGAFSCVLPALNALCAAVYHFGKAGERASKRLDSVTSVMASDIIVEIADAP